MKVQQKQFKNKQTVDTVKKSQTVKKIPLLSMVQIPPKPYASTNIEYDVITELANYLPSASTFEIVERFTAGLAGAKSGRILSITGPYGSGKSTMAAFINGLVSPDNSPEWNRAHGILKKEFSDMAKTLVNARKEAGVHKKGLIRCTVTAKQEPVSATILRALEDGIKNYFGERAPKEFSEFTILQKGIKDLKHNKVMPADQIIDLVVKVCKVAHTIIIIDEFGKNIEYFTNAEDQQSDLFLLQQLAEMSGKNRKILLSIMTLQHMAFEEYVSGASTKQKREWAKIQGRFEDIPFANSPDQTRQLISNTIQHTKKTSNFRKINNWAKTKTEQLKKIGVGNDFDSSVIAECYPLEPLALEILPELCSRYGQHERTLLSFLSNAGQHTVATFIEENYWNDNTPPVMGIDKLYDYFVSGTGMIHSSSMQITRLMEIETIIRDSHGLTDTELKILKVIGILNLIGRSGYLRASAQVIQYAVEDKNKALEKLEKKSIITYRSHADEYRIWHGTDIDIAMKLDLYRKRYQKTSLTDMLSDSMVLDPIIAARHSITKGTMRIFERHFTNESSIITLDAGSDGVVIYTVGNSTVPECKKPIITVSAKNTDNLKRAVTEVLTLKNILNEDNDVKDDWVVRKELEERLSDANIRLYQEFEISYGSKTKWMYNDTVMNGTPSSIVSQVCDEVYHDTPIVYNEMINKTVLSTQGTGARRLLLERMLANTNQPKFGIEGYGPERAVYEALFFKNKIHVIQSDQRKWELRNPKSKTVKPVWDAIRNAIEKAKGRITMSEIYNITQQAPYGMRVGPASIFTIAIILLHKHHIALYEHGTYAPVLSIEIVERMLKNPVHFELKYFRNTPSKQKMLKSVIQDFQINSEGSVLDVVSHLVRAVSALPPYVKQTKKLPKTVTALRDAILKATEPDTLLFDAIPLALGFDSVITKDTKSIPKFSKSLVNATMTLQNAFSETITDLKKLLFDATGTENRAKLSEASRIMLSSVTDEKMRKFLVAVSTDALERNEDWINYVAMSITDSPMINWTDRERDMFENNLKEISAKFQNLASIHFAKASQNFVKPSYQLTLTHANGHENKNVISVRPEQQKKIEKVIKALDQEMKRHGLGKKDINALIAILSSKA